MNKIPNKAWMDFTTDEQHKFRPYITSITWKYEGIVGPVYVNFSIKEKGFFGMQPASRNYRNQKSKHADGSFFAAWYTPEMARKLAKSMHTDFNEC